MTSTVLAAYLDAITRNLDGLPVLRTLEAEGWREDAGLRRALTRLAAQANGHDPARVVARLELKGDRHLDGPGWRADRVTERVAIAASKYGEAAVASLNADARGRAALERAAVERDAVRAEEDARLTPMPADLRARIGRPAPVDATPVPVLEAPALDDRRAVLEHAATSRRLSDGELAELERLTLDAIADGLAAERTAAYLLDPPHRDRVLEHAVAPSPVLDRAQALAAFAHLLTARRRHATPPPGDAVLAVLEHRLGRTLTLRELDLLDALPVSVTLTSLDAANAAADDGDRVPALACSTGRP